MKETHQYHLPLHPEKRISPGMLFGDRKITGPDPKRSFCANCDLFNHTLFYEPRNLSKETYQRQARFFCEEDSDDS